MKILNLVQGTEEWHEARANAFTASEAPAMMGASSFKSREQLLKEKALGIREEISEFQEKLFAKGHEAEEKARAILEFDTDEEFYAVVGEIEHEGMRLLASFDGITMAEDCVWEHKLWNEKKAAAMTEQNELLPEYYWQLEHQLLVSGAQDAIFQMSDGELDGNKFEFTYASVPERRKMLIEGWKQFQQDLADYEKVTEFKPVSKQELALPEICIEVIGQVKASNLPVVKSQITAMIESINENLESDDDFATAEKTVKELKKAEDKLELAKTQMLEGTADINEVLKTIDELKDVSRVKRLALNKLVKDRKEWIKDSIIMESAKEVEQHIEKLNRELSVIRLPFDSYATKHIFVEAIKGKKLFSSMRDAAKDALSQAKVNATLVAQDAQEKLDLFNELAEGYESLFNDLSFILSDDPEQLENRVKAQIAHYQAQRQAEQEHQAQLQAAAEMEREEVACTPQSQPIPDAPQQPAMSETQYALIGLGCASALALVIEQAIKAGRIPNVQYAQAKAA